MLTANSVNIAIPVIFINSKINVEFIADLLANLFNKLITSNNLLNTSIKIKTLAVKDAYNANSGLYCFNIIIITSDTKPIPTIFIISILV